MKSLVLAAFATAVLLTAAPSLHGQSVLDPTTYAMSGTTTTGLSCGLAFDPITFAFTSCSGAWAGNDNGAATPSAATVLDFVNNVSGWGKFNPAQSLALPNVINEPFVLALKGSKAFSLFYFANSAGGLDLTSLDYRQGMRGVSLNKKGKPRRLSHANIYTVPEPGSGLLLLPGLLGFAWIAGRRRGALPV